MANTFTTDPFFALLQNVQDTKTKVSDSIFENYKLQVAQTNDINNRAMQVALQNTSSTADLKAAVSKGILESMLAAQRTDAAIARTSAETQRLIMEQGEMTRALISGLNTQNLNTALINTNTALTGLNGQYAGMGLAYSGVCAAVQNVNTNTAVNALNSATSGQRFINTGVANATVQSSNATSIN